MSKNKWCPRTKLTMDEWDLVDQVIRITYSVTVETLKKNGGKEKKGILKDVIRDVKNLIQKQLINNSFIVINGKLNVNNIKRVYREEKKKMKKKEKKTKKMKKKMKKTKKMMGKMMMKKMIWIIFNLIKNKNIKKFNLSFSFIILFSLSS